MAQTIALKAAGPTVALSVVAAAHAAVAVTPYTNEQLTYVSLLNVGSTTVAVDLDITADTDVSLPGDGASVDFWVLPPLMTQPLVVAVPSYSSATPLYVSAFGSGAGPSLLYVRPVSAL